MLCYLSKSKDIYYHLASEEYFLKNRKEDICMLWTSDDSVVIGKHQNAWAEINPEYLRKKDITVARRLSGGGTVVHGPGNVNFTFITKGEKGKLVDFRKHVTPVIDFLFEKKIPAELGERNEILLHGEKISGNAEHVFKDRVLHHGTLLFNADLDKLRRILKIHPGKYIDKAVQSVRSKVTNIAGKYLGSLSTEEFTIELFQFLLKRNNGQQYEPAPAEIDQIKSLRETKYSQWEWIFGYSPNFKLEREITIGSHNLSFEIWVSKGHITDVIIFGTYESLDLDAVRQVLTGIRFSYSEIHKNIMEAVTDKSFVETFMQVLF